jgi:hypothetical protein
VGAGAGLSVIIGVCCGHSSLVAVGPRLEGLGGGGGGGSVTWHGWKGRVMLTAAVEWGPFIHCRSFMVVHPSSSAPTNPPCEQLLTAVVVGARGLAIICSLTQWWWWLCRG